LINASLFPASTSTGWTDLNLTYVDNSLTTRNLSFYINFPNTTRVYTRDYFGPAPFNQSINTNGTVQNIAGQGYVWGYWSNSTTCGNLSMEQGITLKGPTGKLINLDPCNGYTKG
jgi:hypothetical protein